MSDHYPAMADAWLELRAVLETGLGFKGIPVKDLISRSIEVLHCLHAERAEGTRTTSRGGGRSRATWKGLGSAASACPAE